MTNRTKHGLLFKIELGVLFSLYKVTEKNIYIPCEVLYDINRYIY